MNFDDDASDERFPYGLPYSLQVGLLTIQLHSPVLDETEWTPVEPAAQLDAAQGYEETVRLDIRLSGAPLWLPKYPPGTSDGPMPSEPKPPNPPPKETPS